jgi:RNA polymerase sigma-70 factor (ECF subfamily)
MLMHRSEVGPMAGDQVAELGLARSRDLAFRQLAERHLEASYRLACAILGNRAEAQDATHDAFVQAWKHWSTLRDPARFEHWFDRILVNTCRNRLRRTTRWRTQDLSEDIAAGSHDAMSAALDRDAIASAIRTLSPDHRLVVALRFYRDLTVDEIARQLGVRPGTVHSRLHYAMKRLHSALDEADARGAPR